MVVRHITAVVSFTETVCTRFHTAPISSRALSPLTHTLHDDLNLLVCIWSGVITDAEMLDGYRRAYADRGWTPGFNEVTDLRRADLSAVTSDGLRGVQALVSESTTGFTGAFRTAVLAPTDLTFGLSRMYELMSADSPESVRVCRDVDEAAVWVGVPAKVLSP